MAATPTAKQTPAKQGLTHAELQHVANRFLEVYVATNPGNATRKDMKDWTTADFKAIGDEDLTFLHNIVASKDSEITDSLLPKGMSRADYYHGMVREMARRDILKKDYMAALFKDGSKIEQPVQVVRTTLNFGQPYDPAFPPPAPVSAKVRQAAEVIAMHDLALDVFVTDRPNIHIQPDFAKEVGLNPSRAIVIRNDVDAYDFGYLVGSRKEFMNGGPLGMSAHFGAPGVPDEVVMKNVQELFCTTNQQLFQKGRTFGNRDAAITGYVQARVDSKTNFEPVTEHVGFSADCPALSTQAVVNDNKVTARKKSVSR